MELHDAAVKESRHVVQKSSCKYQRWHDSSPSSTEHLLSSETKNFEWSPGSHLTSAAQTVIMTPANLSPTLLSAFKPVSLLQSWLTGNYLDLSSLLCAEFIRYPNPLTYMHPSCCHTFHTIRSVHAQSLGILLQRNTDVDVSVYCHQNHHPNGNCLRGFEQRENPYLKKREKASIPLKAPKLSVAVGDNPNDTQEDI